MLWDILKTVLLEVLKKYIILYANWHDSVMSNPKFRKGWVVKTEIQ